MNRRFEPSGAHDGSLARLAPADALRATAILVLFGEHLISAADPSPALQSVTKAIGFVGVDAFFVLSGFLLSRPFIGGILGRRKMPDVALYARRRFLRIWPAYFVVVVTTAVCTRVAHARHSIGVADVLAHLAMIQNLSLGFVAGVDNDALWTMAVDAQFYLLLPIFAYGVYLDGMPLVALARLCGFDVADVAASDHARLDLATKRRARLLAFSGDRRLLRAFHVRSKWSTPASAMIAQVDDTTTRLQRATSCARSCHR